MKKIILILIFLIFVIGCAKELENDFEKEALPTENKITGPQGCSSGAECGAACGKSPFDCRAWCKVNKETCTTLGLNSIMEIPEGIPGAPCVKDVDCQTTLCLNFKCEIPSPDNLAKKSRFNLPGSCASMSECAKYCAEPENSNSCLSFCENFPSFCLDLNSIRASIAPSECKECTTCNSKECILDCTYKCYQYIPRSSSSPEELAQLKEGIIFERKYQEPIKAVWEPGPAYNRIGVSYFIDDYQELGVNTYSIAPKYNREGRRLIHSVDHATGEKADNEKAANIIKAKKAGMQVVLVAHDLYDMFPDANRNEKFNPEDYINEIKDTSLKWARVAEDYKVEYFVPINEFEYILYENGYSAERACKITNQLYQEVIPQVREIFKGKIYCRVGGMDAKFGCMNFSQCDLFGFTYGFSDGKNYQSNFEVEFKVGEQLYEKYRIPYIMAEAFALLTRGTTIADCANLHRAGMAAYQETAKYGIGYTFMGLVQRDPINKNDCTITDAKVVDSYKTFFKEMR